MSHSKVFQSVPAIILVLFWVISAKGWCEGSPSPITNDADASGIRLFPATPALSAYTAELLSTSNRFEIQWVNKAPPGYPWAEGYGNRPLIDFRLGLEVPLLGGSSDRWIWYTGMPLAVEVLTDMFESNTAAVVNSDYWFGFRLEALYQLDSKWPSNIALRLLPFYHESTHIGDELALYSAEDNPNGYYRINVSYEAWEFTLCLDEWERNEQKAFTIRLGAAGRWNDAGYYDIPTSAERGSLLQESDFHLSRSNMEYFTQFHAVVPEGFPAIGSWVFQGGFELRNRILLDYFSEAPEERLWTLSTAVGWYRYAEGFYGRRLGFHLRVLYGQNPHGQFREQEGYFMFSTGFSLGL